MAADLRNLGGFVVLDPEEAQNRDLEPTGQLGANHFENCVCASCLLVYKWFTGKDPLEPEQLRQLAAPHSTGGLYFETVLRAMQAHPEIFPDMPPAWVEDPPDVVARIRQLLQEGKPSVFAGKCTSNARYVTQDTGLYHASCPVATDANGIMIWNVFWGEEEYHLDPYWRMAYSGGLIVFDRSLKQATPPSPPKPPPSKPKETEMGFAIYGVAPAGGAFSVGGFYNGTIPKGTRQMWLALYADTIDGNTGDIPVEVYCQGPQGNVGGKDTHTVTPSKATVDYAVGPAGDFGISIHNKGIGPVYITIKAEDTSA